MTAIRCTCQGLPMGPGQECHAHQMPKSTPAPEEITEEQLAVYRQAVTKYEGHPNLGFACCSAHPAADAAAALLAEVERLRTRDARLSALEAYGVDSWDGYEDAVNGVEL